MILTKNIIRFSRFAGLTLFVFFCLWLWNFWDGELFHAWKEEAGPVPFFMALALLPLAGFPTTPFYILAGATFGWVTGLTGSAVSLGINLVLSFWVCRSGLRPLLERVLARTSYRLPQVRHGRAVVFTVTAKLLPGVPAFAKNYLIALSGVSFRTYFLISFPISMMYGAAFVLLGESILEKDLGRVGCVAAVLGLLAFAIWVLRRKLKALRESPVS
ncbi:VTT domain-containing protein [Desulfobotulus sp. H1]|uniref:TVP38/TMEM64 family membrane protein n=1 Tax=Desulfobotulus pelophilus TaxID=2823377 RepID=A0ABT3NB79_9BACT|nr:VTT domain-containing protein [Desulfobotulus pelophilus]MCW7754714.1 VTT domain-containing protein [Desulfobotulus pelophilus]